MIMFLIYIVAKVIDYKHTYHLFTNRKTSILARDRFMGCCGTFVTYWTRCTSCYFAKGIATLKLKRIVTLMCFMSLFLAHYCFYKVLFVSLFFLNKSPEKNPFFSKFKYMFTLNTVLKKFWKIMKCFVINEN